MNPINKAQGRQVVNLSNAKSNRHANVPFIFEMILSLLNTACYAVDPILRELGGFEELGTDDAGLPHTPDEFARKFSQLPDNRRFKYIGSSLHATTNLGLAYAHSFHLLLSLTSRTNKLQVTKKRGSLPKRINMIIEYDNLTKSIRSELNRVYKQVKLHDFEMEVSEGPFQSDNSSGKQVEKEDKFRQELIYWDKQRILQDSNMLFSYPANTTVRLMIPLRSILVLDKIISKVIAPKIGVNYRALDHQLSRRTKDPTIDWDGERIFITLPDKLDNTIEAQWSPRVTSVVRIREVGTLDWSPGIETIFSHCSFVDLKPNTEYDLQVTQKSDAGEGEPAVTRFKSE
ncbi:MAG: fibronectin type III domain-containing protein [Gammaproteobacteria bacterium]|nr:fibronectin type III domain-containing protein [Gammaproteobacteria bacterium]MYD79181.1 fibronectin type III domain-containing protein [Gammaproteobacteria bacterium]